MTVDDKTQLISCGICDGRGETRVIYDDVEVYFPCECRGGPSVGPEPMPLNLRVADPTRARDIFESLVARPRDARLYKLRRQVARAMLTAADHPNLAGVPRLVDTGMILDDLHRSELLSSFRDSHPDLTTRVDRLGHAARALAEMHEIVRDAPLRVRLSDA
jgi:hypothetical protein